MHKIRKVAEYLSLTVEFPRTSKVEIRAVAESMHGVDDKEGFLFVATFHMSKALWIVSKAEVSGETEEGPMVTDGSTQQDWRAGHARTAHPDKVLAYHARAAVRPSPVFPRASLAALFSNFLRYPQQIPGDQWTRVRKLDFAMEHGVPDDNIKTLPALKNELEHHGHACEFTSVNGAAMDATIYAVKEAEHGRLRRKTLNLSALKTPAHRRTADQKE